MSTRPAVFPQSSLIYRAVFVRVTTLCDWLKKLAPLSQPMRNKTKTNNDLLERVFPRLTPCKCVRAGEQVAICAVVREERHVREFGGLAL